MKAMAKIPAVIRAMGMPWKGFGGRASSSFSRMLAKRRSASPKPAPGKETVDSRLKNSVIRLGVYCGRPQNRAVCGYQRQIYAQRLIEPRTRFLHNYLDNLHQPGYDQYEYHGLAKSLY